MRAYAWHLCTKCQCCRCRTTEHAAEECDLQQRHIQSYPKVGKKNT